MNDKERKKQYHEFLDWQTREKAMLKQLEDQKKQRERSELTNNIVQMEGLQKSNRDETKGLKSLMAHQWMSDIEKNKKIR
jgi:hypothetical protein